MPGNPIDKLLDRRRPRRKDVEDALARIAQLVEQRPELGDLAATQAAFVRLAFREPPPLPTITIDERHAATKQAGGVPLLRGEPIAWDARWLRDQFLELSQTLARHRSSGAAGDLQRAAARELQQAVRRGAIDVSALATDVLAGDPAHVTQRAAELDLDVGLVTTLLRWTLLPIMEQLAIVLAPLRQSRWPHGYCPICGAWPLLAEQRGIEQTRHLRCGLCASDWHTERLLCPFCETRAHADIAYLYEESQEATQRAVTCERCHGYYKSVATLTALSTPMLFVTDLATLHLDLIALQRAYAAPG